MELHTIVNHREQDTINRAFIRGDWLDSLLLSRDCTALCASTYKAHFRLMKYINSPSHNMSHALSSIAMALGDTLTAQFYSQDRLQKDHITKCTLAITKSLVLGILSVHGHKDRDAFLLALSSLGLHSTVLQDSCLQ